MTGHQDLLRSSSTSSVLSNHVTQTRRTRISNDNIMSDTERLEHVHSSKTVHDECHTCHALSLSVSRLVCPAHNPLLVKFVH